MAMRALTSVSFTDEFGIPAERVVGGLWERRCSWPELAVGDDNDVY